MKNKTIVNFSVSTVNNKTDIDEDEHKFEWNYDKYSTGIDRIDEQHKTIFDLISRLNSRRKHKVKDSTIFSIAAYVDLHFETEESYFNETVNNERHLLEHKFAKEKVLDFVNKHHDMHHDIGLELTSFLNTWLKNHIITTDLKESWVIKTSNSSDD